MKAIGPGVYLQAGLVVFVKGAAKHVVPVGFVAVVLKYGLDAQKVLYFGDLHCVKKIFLIWILQSKSKISL